MKKPIPWGRAIATVVAILALGVAIVCARQYWRIRSMCADAEATVIAILPDAFGSNGTVEAYFTPKYDYRRAKMVVLELDLHDASGEDYATAVKGLRAQLAIVDGAGNGVLENEVTDERFGPFWMGSETDSPGEYRILITVEQPATPLMGVPHRVVVRCHLCLKPEHVLLALMGRIALLAALICVALTTGVIVATARKRRHHAANDAINL